jgi:hypothetical protein
MPSWNPKDIAGDAENRTKVMAAYGITPVPVEYFHYKTFRYTNLEDALAQANRDLTREASS